MLSSYDVWMWVPSLLSITKSEASQIFANVFFFVLVLTKMCFQRSSWDPKWLGFSSNRLKDTETMSISLSNKYEMLFWRRKAGILFKKAMMQNVPSLKLLLLCWVWLFIKDTYRPIYGLQTKQGCFHCQKHHSTYVCVSSCMCTVLCVQEDVCVDMCVVSVSRMRN